MNINIKTVSISDTAIECGLWHIQRHIMQKHGIDQSYRDMAPLTWYIGTGRASLDFIRMLLIAKPFMVARKLHIGGSYDEVIARVKAYIGYDDSTVAT